MTDQLPSASLVVIGIALCGIGAALIVASLKHLSRVEQATTWAATEGVITRSEIEVSDEYGYLPLVEYRYGVHDATFTSQRVSFGARWGANFTKAIAAAVLAKYPVGARVRVYFDGSEPGQACLEPGPGRGAVLAVQCVGAAVILGGIGCLWFAI